MKNIIHANSDNIEINIYHKTDEAIKELSELLHSVYQNGLDYE